MKLKTLADAYPALTKLAGQDMPLTLLYRFTKLLDALEPDIRFFIQQREKIFCQLGTEENGQYIVFPENAEKFTEEIQKLEEIDSEIDFEKLNLPFRLRISDNVKLSFVDLKHLENIIELVEE